MGLSDLAVYSEYAYSTLTETIAQEVDKFNAASGGTIILSAGSNQGDYSDVASWKKIDGLVRRRNAYGTGSVNSKILENLVDTMVKVASGTPPISIAPSQFTWIQKNPEEAGVILGQQLAGDMLADMLNTGLMAANAAMIQNTAMVHDVTSESPDELTYPAMNKAAGKFGDRSQAISAWVTHSTPYHDLIGSNLANGSQLFKFETVAINVDHVGRPFIITDSPSLITSGSPDTYNCLGLVNGAITVERNDDYLANQETTNGEENIQRTWQAEWTYNVGIKGYAWDKANGGKSPTNAALATSNNWDKFVSNDKDGPGVLLTVDFAA